MITVVSFDSVCAASCAACGDAIPSKRSLGFFPKEQLRSLHSPNRTAGECVFGVLCPLSALCQVPGLADYVEEIVSAMAPREVATESAAMSAVVHPVLMRLKPTDVFPVAMLLYRPSVTKPTA